MTKIQSVVTARYPGFKVDESETESWCNGESFLEVEIEKGDEQDEVEITLLFSREGNLRYRETSVEPGSLPQAVKDRFRKECPTCKSMKEADKLSSEDGGYTVYEVEARKGLSEVAMMIKENGDLVCRK